MRSSLLILLFVSNLVLAQSYDELSNISYYNDSVDDEYIQSQCKLDIYYPTRKEKFSTIVWFHGGGLTSGNRSIPNDLKDQEIAIVAVDYRLSPKVMAHKAIEDAAAAVAWTFENIESYGGDSEKIIVSGHSAGGYLASMVGLDTTYLAKYNVDANRIAGLVPFSGHAITHFTIRAEQGIPGTQAIIDKFAPLYHVRPDAPPYIMITGDREMELLGRYEENAFMWRMMKLAGHKQTYLHELEGYGHLMTAPAFPLLLRYVQDLSK
ncbi:MAG: alpha/beta hydrolase fold domain-containing protein [Bacteroidota bacterium]